MLGGLRSAPTIYPRRINLRAKYIELCHGDGRANLSNPRGKTRGLNIGQFANHVYNKPQGKSHSSLGALGDGKSEKTSNPDGSGNIQR